MKLWKKILLICVITLLCLILVAGIAVYAIISHYIGLIPRETIGTNEPYYEIIDETDFPSTPTKPGTSSGTDPANPGTSTPVVDGTDPVVTDPGAEDPPYVPMDPSEVESLESSIGQNAENNYLMQFDKNITNILLIGTDGRTVTERGRSDSMILLSINKNTKQIVMTSILRDIYLHIPKVNTYNRINAAYSSGGVSLLLDTIEENFKIRIDKYVRINFQGFTNVIDRLGGLDIKLSQAEINFLGMQKTATPGVVHLNGAQVLKFCRCRYVPRDGYGSDFARTYRQREVMTLISQKLKGASFSTLDELLNDFLPQVVTNLTDGEMMNMLLNFSTYMGYEVKSYQIPANGTWQYATIRQMSVLKINFNKNIELLEKYIKGTA